MKTIKALGIDQSLNATGIVFLKDGKIEQQECVAFSASKPLPTYQRINRVCNAVEAQLIENEPDYIQLEGLSFGSKGDTVYRLAALKGCIELVLYQHGYAEGTAADLIAGKTRIWTVVPPSRMKAFAMGEGGAKKDTAYLVKVAEATGITFKNDNIADSYMHALMISYLARVMKGDVEVGNLPDHMQETLMKDGVARRKGLSIAKALKLPETDKLALARQMEL